MYGDSSLTHDNSNADKYGGESSNAQFEGAPLLHKLAVLSPEAFEAVAAVARLAVCAASSVSAWKVQALVLVHASLVVRC